MIVDKQVFADAVSDKPKQCNLVWQDVLLGMPNNSRDWVNIPHAWAEYGSTCRSVDAYLLCLIASRIMQQRGYALVNCRRHYYHRNTIQHAMQRLRSTGILPWVTRYPYGYVVWMQPSKRKPAPSPAENI